MCLISVPSGYFSCCTAISMPFGVYFVTHTHTHTHRWLTVCPPKCPQLQRFVVSGLLLAFRIFTGLKHPGSLYKQAMTGVHYIRLMPVVTIDRGAKQGIAGAGTTTSTEATREQKQSHACCIPDREAGLEVLVCADCPCWIHPIMEITACTQF